MKNSISYGQIAVSIISSVTAGALIGMLLAPRKGREVRRRIKHEKDNLMQAMQNKFDSFMVNLKHENGTEKANAALDGK